MLFVKTNVVYFIETAVIGTNGDFVPGLSLTYDVVKSSDGLSVDSGNMVQEGNAYKASTTFTSNGQHRIFYVSPSGYENGMKQITVFDYDFNDTETILSQLIKLLGLNHENTVIDNQVWEGCKMLSARVRTFANKADADSATNVLNTYSIEATYDTNNRLNFFKQVEE